MGLGSYFSIWINQSMDMWVSKWVSDGMNELPVSHHAQKLILGWFKDLYVKKKNFTRNIVYPYDFS